MPRRTARPALGWLAPAAAPSPDTGGKASDGPCSVCGGTGWVTEQTVATAAVYGGAAAVKTPCPHCRWPEVAAWQETMKQAGEKSQQRSDYMARSTQSWYPHLKGEATNDGS